MPPCTCVSLVRDKEGLLLKRRDTARCGVGIPNPKRAAGATRLREKSTKRVSQTFSNGHGGRGPRGQRRARARIGPLTRLAAP
eukprot:scaffold147702_cov33-Tisochrysis_lutea.AAC.3